MTASDYWTVVDYFDQWSQPCPSFDWATTEIYQTVPIGCLSLIKSDGEVHLFNRGCLSHIFSGEVDPKPTPPMHATGERPCVCDMRDLMSEGHKPSCEWSKK